MIDPDRAALEAALAGRSDHELFPCDPELADTAAFYAHYRFAMVDSANTIVVIGKGAEPVYAPCNSSLAARASFPSRKRSRRGRASRWCRP